IWWQTSRQCNRSGSKETPQEVKTCRIIRRDEADFGACARKSGSGSGKWRVFNTQIGGAVDFIKIDGVVVNVSTNNHPRANAYFAFDEKAVHIIPRTDDNSPEMN